MPADKKNTHDSNEPSFPQKHSTIKLFKVVPGFMMVERLKTLPASVFT